MGAFIATCHLKSNSAYSSSRPHDTPMLDKELPDDYEQRTWREKAHYDQKTRRMFIPAIQFKFAIAEAAKFLNMKVPGKGNETWTKHFTAGIVCPHNLPLPVTVDNVDHIRLYCHANGTRGSGKRVWRIFPFVEAWEGKLDVFVVDELITREIFEVVMRHAGLLIGVGRGRVATGGFYNGQWNLEKLDWKPMS